MSFLGFGKKKKFVDLTEHYNRQQEKINDLREDVREAHSQETQNQDSGSSNGFGFFANMASAGSPNSESSLGSVGESVNPEERRRILNKKLSTITEKLEDLSNQIYHLQQRVEVIERKSGVGRY